MKRPIIARFLVFSMLLSLLCVPAMAVDVMAVDVDELIWVDNIYTLTDDIQLTGKISGTGTYTINASTYRLTADTVTVEQGSELSVYGGSDSNQLLFTATGGAKLTGMNVYYIGESTDSITGTVTLKTSNASFRYLTTIASDLSVSTDPIVNYSKDVSSLDGYTTVKYVYETNHSDDRDDSGDGDSSSTTYTVPVTGGTSSTSVPVAAAISGSKATVKTPTATEMTKIMNNAAATGLVVADLSGANKNITTATVSVELVSETAKSAAEPAFEVALPGGTVTLDSTAVDALADFGGKDITLELQTKTDTTGMTEAQKESVADLSTGVIIDVSLNVDGKIVSSFGGGSYEVSVPFTPPAGQDGNKFTIYYVNESGELEAMETTYANGRLTMNAGHMSKFIAIFEPFVDVRATDWHAKYVQYVYDKGIMRGVGNDMFVPNTNMSRAMMVQTLYNIKGASADASAVFSDVKAGDWFADAVNWAASANVAYGIGGGKFDPNASMTREQMAQFLYNYAKANGRDTSKKGDLSQFTDAASVSGWATEAVAWAVGNGYINGVGGNTLAPQGTATRATVATILTRFEKA